MKTYRNVALYPVSVDNGRTIEPGGTVELPENPSTHDKVHIQYGRLVQIEEPQQDEANDVPPADDVQPVDLDEEVTQ